VHVSLVNNAAQRHKNHHRNNRIFSKFYAKARHCVLVQVSEELALTAPAELIFTLDTFHMRTSTVFLNQNATGRVWARLGKYYFPQVVTQVAEVYFELHYLGTVVPFLLAKTTAKGVATLLKLFRESVPEVGTAVRGASSDVFRVCSVVG
jgi:hypothetical protein